MSMHRVYVAALELQEALNELGRPYCFIGGLALQRWGEVRFTQDADATVLSAFQHDEEVIQKLCAQFKRRRSDAQEFARRNRVLLLEAKNGVGLDVALGALLFEAQAVERASPWKLPTGDHLRTCSADDLIVHKAFAAREKDWLDIDGILVRQADSLRIAQIFDDLRDLVLLKQDDEIIPRLRKLMNKRGIAV